MVAAQVHVIPADNDRHGAISTHADEKERGVLQVQAVVDVEEDGEAGKGDANGADGEGEAVASQVRGDGDEHTKAKRGSPGRDGVELSLDGAVLVGCDDGRAKVGVAVGWAVWLG